MKNFLEFGGPGYPMFNHCALITSLCQSEDFNPQFPETSFFPFLYSSWNLPAHQLFSFFNFVFLNFCLDLLGLQIVAWLWHNWAYISSLCIFLLYVLIVDLQFLWLDISTCLKSVTPFRWSVVLRMTLWSSDLLIFLVVWIHVNVMCAIPIRVYILYVMQLSSHLLRCVCFKDNKAFCKINLMAEIHIHLTGKTASHVFYPKI